jgi:hypothetical protein
MLHEITDRRGLVFVILKDRLQGSFKNAESLFGVLPTAKPIGDRDGGVDVLVDRSLMNREVDAAATLPAVPGEWHPTVALSAVETPRFLPRKRSKIADQIGEEVVLNNAFGHIGLVDCPKFPR